MTQAESNILNKLFDTYSLKAEITLLNFKEVVDLKITTLLEWVFQKAFQICF